MGKTYEGIWRLVFKASYIGSGGGLNIRIKKRFSTSLMYGGDRSGAGKRCASSIKRGW